MKHALAAAAAFVAATLAPAPSAAAGVAPGPAERAGDVTVVEHSGSSRTRRRGGSDTEFSLRLPAGASCPGDSANDDYRVQSFLIPAADDPAALQWQSVRPVGDHRWELFELNTRSFSDAFTAERERPGAPGVIVNIPSLSLAVFPPGELDRGRYRMGIACTLAGAVARYWDTEVRVVADRDDRPGRFRWELANSSIAPAGDDVSSAVMVIGLTAGAAVTGTAALLLYRRRRATATTSEAR